MCKTVVQGQRQRREIRRVSANHGLERTDDGARGSKGAERVRLKHHDAYILIILVRIVTVLAYIHELTRHSRSVRAKDQRSFNLKLSL